VLTEVRQMLTGLVCITQSAGDCGINTRTLSWRWLPQLTGVSLSVMVNLVGCDAWARCHSQMLDDQQSGNPCQDSLSVLRFSGRGACNWRRHRSYQPNTAARISRRIFRLRSSGACLEATPPLTKELSTGHNIISYFSHAPPLWQSSE